MKAELYKNEKTAITNEIRDKYKFYAEIVRQNRLDTPHIHKQYCQSENHRQCGAKWGHADIVREIIAKLWWWFTGEQPHSVNVSHKPRFQYIREQIFKQRKEGELEDAEYSWLIDITNKCKQLVDSK